MSRILIAEDDPKQADVIRRYAVADGHTVSVVHDGRDAIEEARRARPDLLVLDLMMPGLDGLDVCRIVRADAMLRDTALLMVTARTDERDLLAALDLGIDDYLKKPYSPRELMGRIRALLRRVARGEGDRDATITVGEITIDPRTREVRSAGTPIECTPTEFDVLATLATEPGRVFSRRQLQGEGTSYISPRVVDMHVANLRKKLGAERIRTVYGVGYAMSVAPPA